VTTLVTPARPFPVRCATVLPANEYHRAADTAVADDDVTSIPPGRYTVTFAPSTLTRRDPSASS
jgi:hypothetical protein